MDCEFVIPLQKDELLESHVGQYHVEDVVQQRFLSSKLQEGVRALNSNGPDFIFEHFDTYFSIIVHGNKLEWTLINKGFEYVERACQQLCGLLETLFQEKDIDTETRCRNLNCLKMLLYLYTSLMKVKDSKLQAEMAASLSLGGKRGKKAANTDTADKDSEWKESDRRTALDVMYNLLQLQLHRLWDPPLADDTFVDMVAQPCYRAMEDSTIKNKTTRETVFQVLGVLNKKYNHGMSCTIKLVQMVQLYEHAVLPICAGIAQLVSSWGLAGMVAKLVREVGEALGGDGSGEGDKEAVGAVVGESGPTQRNCALFLAELTQLLPGHMISAAQHMRCHLETDESYPLRCSVLGMMCEILCKELKGEGLSEERKTMRDEFLDDLEDHLHDVSAYVRSRVLQNWCRLQKEGCIPVTRQQKVLSRAVGRLQDKATLVRKNAVQLIKVFIEHNPFSAQLKLDILKEELGKEKKNLEETRKKLNPDVNPELLSKWEEMKDEIRKVIESRIDQPTQDDPPLSQGTVNDAYANIRKYLKSKEYYEAFVLTRHAERMYPEAKLLRAEMDKKDQVSYFLSLLYNVFVTDNQSSSESEEVDLITQLEAKENIVAFLEESISFGELVQQAVPLVYTLLMSKQATDVYEAIDFFTTAHSFNIETANLGIMGMLQLVWSPDQEKRDAVEKAYRSMYLSSESSNERAIAGVAASRILKLVKGCNKGHSAALQALLARWLRQGDIGPPFIQVLWEVFTKKHEDTTESDRIAALSVLVMLARAKSSVASANMEVLQTIGLKGCYKTRVLSLQMLLTMGQPQQRMAFDAPLLQNINDMVVDSFFVSEHFAALGSTAVDVIYALCDTPDLQVVKLLNSITQRLNDEFGGSDEIDLVSCPVEYLSRIVILFGQTAVQQLIFLDVTVYGELRRRNEVREQRKVAGTKSGVSVGAKNKAHGDDISFNSSSASARRLRTLNASQQQEGEEEDELGLEGAVADDADAELVRAVCEAEVVGGGAGGVMAQDALLANVAPLLRALLAPAQYSTTPDKLRAAACLALGRFMLISSTFCEDHMQLFMTTLKNSTSSSIRCNIIITLSDLTLRFPNVIQPWTQFIYDRLEDKCVEVRQCTVKMLSYLILQEMVRVRGQVASMARRCVDPDQSTRTMALLFFKQLSHKGNSLYNVIPDIISRLSDPDLELPEEEFRTIIKYIMSLIQKDRQMEALVEKLCLRFKLSSVERQWRDLAYCLSLFSYNERSVKKLIENMDCYKDKLYHKEVYDCFKTIISNSGKMAKADLKAIVAELNDKIEECFKVQEAGAVLGDGAENDENARPSNPRPPATPKTNARRNRARKSNSSSESDEDFEKTPVKNRGRVDESVRTSARKRAPMKNRNLEESDESDEDEYEFKKPPEKKEVFKKPVGRATRKRK